MGGSIKLNGGAIGETPVMAYQEIRVAGSYDLNIDDLAGPIYPPEPPGGGDDDDGADDGDDGDDDYSVALYCIAWSR